MTARASAGEARRRADEADARLGRLLRALRRPEAAVAERIRVLTSGGGGSATSPPQAAAAVTRARSTAAAGANQAPARRQRSARGSGGVAPALPPDDESSGDAVGAQEGEDEQAGDDDTGEAPATAAPLLRGRDAKRRRRQLIADAGYRGAAAGGEGPSQLAKSELGTRRRAPRRATRSARPV